MKFERRIVVDEIEQHLATKYESRDHLMRMYGLTIARDHSGLDQVHYGIRHHLRVDAEVLAIAQQPEPRLRNPANPRLNRRSVRNQARHMPPDGALQLRH